MSGLVAAANVLRFIASGVFGEAAFTSGTNVAVWGVLFHYRIALTFVGLFWWRWLF